jgi:phage terminase Nu1 subunit (DNA packaging protein)
MKVNMQKLADILGVTRKTIRERMNKGLPYESRGDTGREYVFDSVKVIAWMIEHAQEGGFQRGLKPDLNLNDLKKRKLEAEAMRVEIEIAKEMKTLVNVDDAVSGIASAATTFRQQIQNIPRRVTPLLLGETDEQVAREILSSQLEECLNELSQIFAEEAEKLTDE